MTLMIARRVGSGVAPWRKILGASLAAAFAPGFVVGVFVGVMQIGGRNGAVTLLTAPLLFSLIGAVVGAPFAMFIFAPAIYFLGRLWRLNWLATTTIGFCSVFIVVSSTASSKTISRTAVCRTLCSAASARSRVALSGSWSATWALTAKRIKSLNKIAPRTARLCNS